MCGLSLCFSDTVINFLGFACVCVDLTLYLIIGSRQYKDKYTLGQRIKCRSLLTLSFKSGVHYHIEILYTHYLSL